VIPRGAVRRSNRPVAGLSLETPGRVRERRLAIVLRKTPSHLDQPRTPGRPLVVVRTLRLAGQQQLRTPGGVALGKGCPALSGRGEPERRPFAGAGSGRLGWPGRAPMDAERRAVRRQLRAIGRRSCERSL